MDAPPDVTETTWRRCGYGSARSAQRRKCRRQGEVTCFSGAQSGNEHCTTVQAIDQCVHYNEQNLTLCHQETAGFAGIPGDSGGPWYLPQSTGTSMAQGLESGSNGTTSNYTQIATALSGLGNYYVYSG